MPLPYQRLSEHAIRFDIEELSPPTELLPEISLQDLANELCPKLEAVNKAELSLVNGQYHAFFYGLYKSYAEHRPFRLSPDMIWLLVLQGVSTFINNTSPENQSLFPQIKSKETIRIQHNGIQLGDPNSPWEETTAMLTEAVEKTLGNDLVQLLRADFSTTGLSERVASEITILDALKPYFEYIVAFAVCGIPTVTLEGTVEDWDKILQKLEGLKAYQLDWWVEELSPIITQIKATAAGHIDQTFWMNFFKVHTRDGYGSPKGVDGWITRFFPFDRDGKRQKMWERNYGSVESAIESLPKQLVQVPFKYQICAPDNTVLKEYDMEYWAGFVGIEQDEASFELCPKIHWWVAHADKTIKSINEEHARFAGGKRYHGIEEIPEEVFEQKEWEILSLHFKNEITIPMQLGQLSIGMLELHGTLSTFQKLKLRAMLLGKETYVELNEAPLFKD